MSNKRKENSIGLSMCVFVILIITLSLSGLFVSAQEGSTKNILVLNSYHYGFPWTDNLVDGFVSGMGIEDNNIELRVEYMDTKTMGYGDEYKQRLYEFYKYKYQDYDFDLIISSDDNAFDFLREYHEELFPGVPVVFGGVNNADAPNLVDPNEFTGILETTPHEETIDLILDLHPKTKKIFLVIDKTLSGDYQWGVTESSFSRYPDIEFTRLSDDFTISEIEDIVGGLAEDSAVIFLVLSRDKTGEYLSLEESLNRITKASARPVYTTHLQGMPYGVVGGKLLGGFYQGEFMSNIANRVLNGEEVSSIPIIRKSPTQFMFDYVQLEKWGIEISDLPKDSVIVNKPFSFYKEYKFSILSILVIIIILIAFVILFISKYISSSKINMEMNQTLKEKRKINNQFQKKNEELERFVNLTVGRENKMIELKKKLKEFEKNGK